MSVNATEARTFAANNNKSSQCPFNSTIPPPSDHFAVHLTHLIAKNNTDNRMEVVFLWVDRPWIAYIHMWRCVAMCGSCGKQQKGNPNTRTNTRRGKKCVRSGRGKRDSGNFEGAGSANWEFSRLQVQHLFPPALS